jgi:hypothetical protein
MKEPVRRVVGVWFFLFYFILEDCRRLDNPKRMRPTPLNVINSPRIKRNAAVSFGSGADNAWMYLLIRKTPAQLKTYPAIIRALENMFVSWLFLKECCCSKT